MTMQEWIERYEKKAEPFEPEEGSEIFFRQDKGIVCYKVMGDTLYIDHTSTDDWKWGRDSMAKIARERGCKRLMTYVFRNPKAYARLTGAHLVPRESRYLANGKFYWAFEEVL